MVVSQVGKFLVDLWVAVYNMLYTGGIIGLSIIVLIVLRKLVAVMRQFTN